MRRELIEAVEGVGAVEELQQEWCRCLAVDLRGDAHGCERMGGTSRADARTDVRDATSLQVLWACAKN